MVKIYDGSELAAEIPLEESAYVFRISLLSGETLEGVVYSYKNTDWRVMMSDGWRARDFLTRGEALRAVAKRYKLGKFADEA
ncbi:MAG: hypothetical protein RML95_13940 [Anaerolineae bacterium]|nr:hypothetical protein [Anaerolineae bacterium]MDW8300426.1 hypothetical protein [Anaerolineae bacterium]